VSFSSRVKDELAQARTLTPCCQKAQSYGLLLLGRDFSVSSVKITTEHAQTAALYKQALAGIPLPENSISTVQKTNYTVSVVNEPARRAVLEYFGHSETDISLRLNRANLVNDCCFRSFLRGAFLSSANMSEPEKSYHLEFSVSRAKLAGDIAALLSEMDLNPKIIVRDGKHIVYFKDSAGIEDLLTAAGAQDAALELMRIKIVKDFINKSKRRQNCDTANIDKSVNAAVKQVAAVKKLMHSNRLDALPPQLLETAHIRVDNPYSTLEEMIRLHPAPITRSGLSHRLKRIVEIASEDGET